MPQRLIDAGLAADAGTPRALSDRIYEDIYRRISSGALAQGDRLPTELEFAESFGVSRTVVREALLRLKIDGLITSRQGAGHYVQARPSRNVLDFTKPGSIADIQRCFEFRVGVEGEAAYLAAERRSAEHLQALEAVLEATRESLARGGDGVEEDVGFHTAVARATENDYYETTIISGTAAMRVGINIARTLGAGTAGRRLEVVLREHLGIFQAIRDSDPDAARRRMRAHIDGARRRVFVGSA